jgi:hypothetical protein
VGRDIGALLAGAIQVQTVHVELIRHVEEIVIVEGRDSQRDGLKTVYYGLSSVKDRRKGWYSQR